MIDRSMTVTDVTYVQGGNLSGGLLRSSLLLRLDRTHTYTHIHAEAGGCVRSGLENYSQSLL